MEEIERAFTEPRYLEVIRPDEDKLLDPPSCTIFIVEEVPMHEEETISVTQRADGL